MQNRKRQGRHYIYEWERAKAQGKRRDWRQKRIRKRKRWRTLPHWCFCENRCGSVEARTPPTLGGKLCDVVFWLCKPWLSFSDFLFYHFFLFFTTDCMMGWKKLHPKRDIPPWSPSAGWPLKKFVPNEDLPPEGVLKKFAPKKDIPPERWSWCVSLCRKITTNIWLWRSHSYTIYIHIL